MKVLPDGILLRSPYRLPTRDRWRRPASGRRTRLDVNRFGQAVGALVEGWTPPPLPPRRRMTGRWCALEPADDAAHAHDLFEAFAEDEPMWTYMPYGPFASERDLRAWMREMCAAEDLRFFAVLTGSGSRLRAAGLASYLRIAPAHGSIEIGHLSFGAGLRRSTAATEALIMMIEQAFELGYRRVEWKCDALNAASRRAAQRLGLSYEGTFRHALVVKGRNRDTSWYAATDADRPLLSAAFRVWLDPANFDTHGEQRCRLSALTEPLLVQRG